jgi:hypothetical protein
MNALEKRDAITQELNGRNDALGILTRYGVTRTDIGKNAPNFTAVRDAMYDELCGAGAPTTLGEVQTVQGAHAGSMMPAAPAAAPAAGLAGLQSTLQAMLGQINALATSPAAPSAPAAHVDLSGVESRLTFVEGNISTLDAQQTALRDELNALNTALAGAPPTVRARVSTAIAAATGGLSPLRSFLAKMLPPGANHEGIAVLAMGGSGTGKSWDAEEHAKAFDYSRRFGCSPVTEKHELFGCVTQTETGLAFCDGFISAGIRHAGNGETVCLIVDEVFRLSDNLKNEFLSLLTPTVATGGVHAGKMVYSLPTGRGIVDAATGLAEPEILTCPVESIAFVGTSNIGTQFMVMSGGVDEAFYKRWSHFRVNWDAAHAQTVFEKCLDAHGFKTSNAMHLLAFVEATRTLAQHGNVAYPACLRTITRAIRTADKWDAGADGLKQALDYLCAQTFPGWEHNGETIQANLDAQEAMLRSLINSIK